MDKGFEKSMERLLKLLEKAIEANAEEESGLLFSAGIDSLLLAMLFKRMKLRFKCFFGFAEGIGKPNDLEFVKKAAKQLGLRAETASVEIEEVPGLLEEIVPLIGTSNPVQVGVALPLFLACKKAGEQGIKTVFSGMGADELFLGYARFKESKNVKKDSGDSLEKLQKEDFCRDKAIAGKFGLKLKTPYLEPKIIEFALSLKKEFKLADGRNKLILRELGRRLGLGEEFAERKKVAAQYGSNFDRAIGKLAKKAGARGKKDYLERFAKKAHAKGKADYLAGFDKKKAGLAALFSGGKDSCLALWKMQNKGFDVKCLISVIPQNEDSFMYHKPNLQIVKLQSKALGIPLITEKTKGEKETELGALKKALLEAKEKFAVQGVVTGALHSSYQKHRIEKICRGLNLRVFSPLWHMKQEDELKELVDNGFVFVISKIAAKGLGEKWLGRTIGEKEIAELMQLNEKFGFNVAGEGGEFETIVLNAPNFKKRMRIVKSGKRMENEFTGRIEIGKAVLESKQL